jgi:hypothetical protein
MRILHIVLFCILSNICFAQNNFHFGYYINPSLNLYQRLHQPQTAFSDNKERSTGQGLNILPGLSTGLWIGKAKTFAIGLEAGVEYLPFSFNLQHFNGMGSLAFPVLMRAHIPIKKQHASHISLDVAGGLQWNKSNLYFNNNNSLPFFISYTLEFAAGIGAVSQKAKQIRGTDLFFRFGFGADNSLSFQTGLRMHFWNALF